MIAHRAAAAGIYDDEALRDGVVQVGRRRVPGEQLDVHLLRLQPREQREKRVVASGAARALTESERSRRRARRGALDGAGARRRDVGKEEQYDDELRVPDGHVEGPARRRDQAAEALVEGPAQTVDDTVDALAVQLPAPEDSQSAGDDCKTLGVGL